MPIEWNLLTILGIVAQTLVIMATVGGFLNRILKDQINGATERLDTAIKQVKVEQSLYERESAARNQAVQSMKEKQQAMEFSISSLERDSGRFEGMFQRFIQEAKEDRSVRLQEEKIMIAKLANIEANMNVSRALEQGFKELATWLRTERRRSRDEDK